MPEKTPAARGDRLIDALIVWITPDRPLEPGRFEVRVSEPGEAELQSAVDAVDAELDAADQDLVATACRIARLGSLQATILGGGAGGRGGTGCGGWGGGGGGGGL